MTSSTGLAVAFLLIATGVALLATRFLGGGTGFLWPFFVILPGAALTFVAARAEWPVGLLVAGALVLGSGVILLVQNYFDYYRSWAYAWTLLPAFAGAALVYSGNRTRDEERSQRGRELMRWSGAAFVILGAIFELVIFSGGGVWGSIVLPLALIGAGGIILLFRRGRATASVEAGHLPDSEATPKSR